MSFRLRTLGGWFFSLKVFASASLGVSTFISGTSNNDCVNWRSFREFPNLRQALFQAGSKSVLTGKSIFAGLERSLECTPQRRCGGMVDATDLKSVLAKSGVWVRLPSSAPLKLRFSFVDALGLVSLAVRPVGDYINELSFGLLKTNVSR